MLAETPEHVQAQRGSQHVTGAPEPGVVVSVGSLTPRAAGNTKVVKVASDPGVFTALIGSQNWAV